MKRLFIVFFLSLFTVSVLAQQHLQFMGIPLNGTINQFQQKLQAKGVRYDRQDSAITPVGTRVFKGTFAGYAAKIAVYYDETTKQVYAAKAYIDIVTEDRANSIATDFEQSIKTKYGDCLLIDDDDTYYILDSTKQQVLGFITIYIRQDESYINYPYNYSVHIQYNDFLNTNEHDSITLDDF